MGQSHFGKPVDPVPILAPILMSYKGFFRIKLSLDSKLSAVIEVVCRQQV